VSDTLKMILIGACLNDVPASVRSLSEAHSEGILCARSPLMQRTVCNCDMASSQTGPSRTEQRKKDSQGGMATIRLIGHFQSEHVEELKKQLQHNGPRFVLDLTEVTLVDLDVVRFLGICEADGVQLINCPPYIREWMRQERKA
jgi:hypothetical protein